MAQMIDSRPEDFYGEMIVWDALKANLPDDYIVYHGREVRGKQYDFCVLMPNKAILIIEVKGWFPNTVTVIDADHIQLNEPFGIQKSPKKQAREYRFTLINIIKEKLKANPCVFDMVCFPQITKAEYLKLNLDKVVEEEFTLFKEDLENEKVLDEKITTAGANLWSYYDDLDNDLIYRIRQMNEINVPIVQTTVNQCYSELRCINASQGDSNTVKDIIEQYVIGVKQIVFTNSKALYDQILDELQAKFLDYKICPKGMNVEFGNECDLSKYKSKNESKLFNFEMYLLSYEANISSFVVQDGCCSAQEERDLISLSDGTTFNFQQYCVEHADSNKNVLVKAGAGTGKTFSMISRVAYLCNKSKDRMKDIAEELAMVTFTNEAADNMKKRLKRMFMNYAVLTGDEKYHSYISDVDRARIMTIHKFAIEILRQLSMYTGLGSQFSISVDQYTRDAIYDRYFDDFLKRRIEENKNFPNTLPVQLYEIKKQLLQLADKTLTKSIDLEEVVQSQFGSASSYLPYFNELVKEVMIPAELEYLDYMHSLNEMNLSETIIMLNRILKKNINEVKLNDYQIRYLFIDEFQDTDDVQIDLFEKLQRIIGKNCKVFVVGDIKQSIYRFRGATVSSFERLNEFAYEWNPTYHLNRNYRTESRLLDTLDPIFQTLNNLQFLKYGPDDRLLGTKRFHTTDEDVLTCVPVHGKDAEAFYDQLFSTIAEQKNRLKLSCKMGRFQKKKEQLRFL